LNNFHGKHDDLIMSRIGESSSLMSGRIGAIPALLAVRVVLVILLAHRETDCCCGGTLL
jgi:hypothetical protein